MLPDIAITGLGVVSPLGVGFADFAASLSHGVTALDASAADPTHLAAEVAEWDAQPYLVAEKTYLDRASEFALAAAKLCLDDAGLTGPPAAEERAGLVLGTRFGCGATMAAYTDRLRKRGARFATPVLFTHSFANTPASLVAIDFRLRGYHATVTSGRGSGGQALLTAMVGLAQGHCDAVLAGGVEALYPELLAASCDRLWEGDDPDAYDPLANDGVVLGEGGCLLLLERLADAAARGAAVRAVLTVAGEPGDGPTMVVRGPAEGLVSAPGSLFGDASGAAGPLTVAAAVAALEQQTLPPVIAGAPGHDPREPYPTSFDRVTVSEPQDAGPALVFSVRRGG